MKQDLKKEIADLESRSVVDMINNKNGFNFVDITTTGCEGWLNLFYKDEIIALINDPKLADKIRNTIHDSSRRETNARLETLGWAYADACVSLDNGEDYRKTELPAIAARAAKDLGFKYRPDS